MSEIEGIEMIRLEDILPGDIVIDDCNHEGIVCKLEELGDKRNSHLNGGNFVWAIWSSMEYNKPLFVLKDEIKEHRPQSTQYDPSQQPYTEDDI